MINKQDGNIRYYLLGSVLLVAVGGWYFLGREDSAAPEDEVLLAKYGQKRRRDFEEMSVVCES